MVDLAASETSMGIYVRDDFLLLQTVINEGYLDVDRTFAILPNTEEKMSYFSEGGCVCINSICRAKVSSHDYPFNVEVTVLSMLPGGVVCVVGADQRLAARYQIRVLHCISVSGTR